MAFMKVLSAALLLVLASPQPCCGQVSTRIVGGTPVGSDRFPYFALLQGTYVRNGRVYVETCGGTLITAQVVLTAAHCIDNPLITSIRVTLDRYSTQGDTNYLQVNAESWTYHPNYDSGTIANDIGIVKLSQKVAIAPISLSFTSGFPAQGLDVTVIGYGLTADNGNLSNELRQVQFAVRSGSDCSLFYRVFSKTLQICAGGIGKNPCSGDSGGPMIVKGTSGNDDTLAGIVSYGFITCNELPSGFTRVSAYKNWIVQNACEGNNLPSWCNGDISTNSPNSPSPTPTPKPTNFFPGCFAGSNQVHVEDRGPVRMDDLKVGDMVHVGKGFYEPIYSFGHFAPTTFATFVRVDTAKSTLLLTNDHMVFTNRHKSVPASALKVGDFVVGDSGEEVRVERIQSVGERGLYAPFTPSGKIVVNNILVSSYVALLDEKDLTLSVGWMSLSHHWLSHAAVFPHRLVCYHFASCPAERYNIDGISMWHAHALQFSQLLLGGGSLVRIFLVATMVFVATIVTAVEALTWWSALVMILCTVLAIGGGAHTLRLKFKHF